jgi:hypothetical protein
MDAISEADSKKRPSNRAIRGQRETAALEVIGRVGWMRAREIGHIFWPNVLPESRLRYARSLCQGLVQQRLVIKKTLPYQYGDAYLLSKKGADFLNDVLEIVDEDGEILGDFLPYSTGKKIGDHLEKDVGGRSRKATWTPSAGWRHDILAAGVVAHVLGGGGMVITEREIRQSNARRKDQIKRGEKGVDLDIKIPDALISHDGRNWTAIEVERSGKFASYAYEIARFIVTVNAGGTYIAGALVTNVAIVYEDPQAAHYRSEDRHLPDHTKRITAAVQRVMQPADEIAIISIPVQTIAGGVETMSQSACVVEYNVDLAKAAWLRVKVRDSWTNYAYGHRSATTPDSSWASAYALLPVKGYRVSLTKQESQGKFPVDGVMQLFDATLTHAGDGIDRDVDSVTFQATTFSRAQERVVRWLQSTEIWHKIKETDVDMVIAKESFRRRKLKDESPV